MVTTAAIAPSTTRAGIDIRMCDGPGPVESPEWGLGGWLIRFVRLAILNLAGVPSIVFGLFGFGMLVVFFGWNVSLLAGWFTLAFMVLPVVITASEESLKSVPKGFREGSLALGATKWQTIRQSVLPYALPGILTSSILGIARVAGETAPLLLTSQYALRLTTNMFDSTMASMPTYIFGALRTGTDLSLARAWGGALVLIALIVLLSVTARVLGGRNKGRK